MLSPLLLLALLLPISVEGNLSYDPGPDPFMEAPDPAHAMPDPKAATSSKALGVPQKRSCPDPPRRVLRQTLGPAFISTYMVEEDELYLKQKRQTDKQSLRSFYFENNFHEVLSDQPAWEVNFEMPSLMVGAESDILLPNHRTSKGRRLMLDSDLLEKEVQRETSWSKEMNTERRKEDTDSEEHERLNRGTSPGNRLFHCEAPLRYRNLGPMYYPQFIREADCSKCTGKPHVKCVSHNFVVHVLHRLEECVPKGSNIRGFTLVEERTATENGLWRKWVFEKLSVSFCCICMG